MDTKYTKKAVPFLILKVLEKYTDENHYITQQKIVEKLFDDFQMVVERKSVSSNIKLLEDLDYDIARGEGGVALIERVLNKYEIQYIADSVYSNKTLSAKTANDIIEKISEKESMYFKNNYKDLYRTGDVKRNKNKDLFNIIDTIEEAKKLKKRIEFNYISYNEKGEKINKYGDFRPRVSPYFLVNNFGVYYLLGYYRGNKFGHPFNIYRVDRMEKVTISDWDEKPKEEAGLSKDFSIAQFLNEHVYLFSDEVVDAKLELLNPDQILNIKEYFSDGAKIKYEDDKLFAYIKCDKLALTYWIMQYGEFIRVVSPESLKENVVNTLNRMLDLYK
ncbi:MAG: WYL domain-containing protein [Gammaproteobacteria bacterium]|nr:WYL domain-containing protein [Gammaproteobacteria bacterium]